MFDAEDYTDDPLQTGADAGEAIEGRATDAIDALDGGPSTGEVADAVSDIEVAMDEIRLQQEAAEEAIDRLTGSRYGSGGVRSLAEGADDAYDLVEEIRAMSRRLVEGMIAASRPEESVSETTILIDGSEYRIRIVPLEEADTADPIPNDETTEPFGGDGDESE